ncbi:GLUG motif-containing protein, partial [Billgrantia endophytica]
MNRLYRTLHRFSSRRALGVWRVVAETARGRGKSSLGGSAAVALLGVVVLAPSQAHAADLPSGGQVVLGDGQIGLPDGRHLTIDQLSDKLAIDWDSFDIGADHRVTFQQPGADAIALNRVLGADGSAILGQLDANGRVFLLNPNGVLFGPGAEVNVGGLVASTLALSNEDFAAGDFHFQGDGGNAGIVNHGSIRAADGGAIALLGGTVSNHGTLVAHQGSVALAAGDAITLDFAGDGLLNVQVDEAVVDALVENHQLIQADGGQVLLTANAGDALLQTVVNHTGVIEAQTLDERDGRIVLLGDFAGGSVEVAGTLDASAPHGGDGGFIDTSGAHVRIHDGTSVTTLAADGRTGDWLIDPTDFTIGEGNAEKSDSGIGAATLAANLESSNIELATVASGDEPGDIHVDAAVDWYENTTLTLSAHNDIHVNADISARGDSAGLVLNHGGYRQNDGTTSPGSDYHLNGASITLGGDDASLEINGQNYTLIHTVEELQDMAGSGHYALGGEIDARATAGWNDGAGFDPIGGNSSTRFTGTFAGLGHTIGDLTIARSGPIGTQVGLFGYAGSGATIRDIGLVGGSVSGNRFVGGLVGYNRGSITDAYATGAVTGNSDVGGLVGRNYGSISQAYATGDVEGSGSRVGGLVGDNQGSISHAYATGDVEGSGSRVGGLVGRNYGSITDAYATGAVTGSSDVGGLVGGNPGGSISQAYATGDVTASSDVGGLVGSNPGGSISQAYATGDVEGSGNVVGGLVGDNWNGSITDAYATGSVSGNNNVGGLVGYNSGSGSISDAFRATTDADGNPINTGLNSLGTGRTWDELTSLETFAGWDIDGQGGSDTLWRLYEGHTTPLLRGFLTPITVTANDDTVTYDGTSQTGAAGYAIDPHDADLLSGSDSITGGGRDAGTHTLGLDGLWSTQQGYDLIVDEGTLTIDPRPITVSADDLAKVYGEADPTLTWQVTEGNLVFDDSLSGSLSRDAGENVGGYTIGQGSLEHGNYAITFDEGVLTITAIPTPEPEPTPDPGAAVMPPGYLAALGSAHTQARTQAEEQDRAGGDIDTRLPAGDEEGEAGGLYRVVDG